MAPYRQSPNCSNRWSSFSWLRMYSRVTGWSRPTVENMVERFFRDISENRIKRHSFTSVADLEQAIAQYVEHHNQDPKPFIWTARTDVILAKVTCAKAALVRVAR